MTELAFELLRISFSNRYASNGLSVSAMLSNVRPDRYGACDNIVQAPRHVMSLLDRRSDPCGEMLPRPGFSR